PENLLFKTQDENSELMIADFGLSRIIDHEKFHLLTTTCGTPGYMAPEIFQKSGHGKPVDMWAVGVITYFLLCGYPPFDRQNSMDEVHAILNAEYRFEPVEYWQGVSETAKSFPFQPRSDTGSSGDMDGVVELLPSMMARMKAKSRLRNAIQAVNAINKLRGVGKEDPCNILSEEVSHVLHREDEDMDII
ncbi:hypothetical protein BGZ65_006353, partial [Modicella reniformis]